MKFGGVLLAIKDSYDYEGQSRAHGKIIQYWVIQELIPAKWMTASFLYNRLSPS
jgi:hypothetical protein